LTNVYCRIRRPAPFLGAGIGLPQPRWLAPPANIPSASGAKNNDFAIYWQYRRTKAPRLASYIFGASFLATYYQRYYHTRWKSSEIKAVF
jgi:hypothetical protein